MEKVIKKLILMVVLVVSCHQMFASRSGSDESFDRVSSLSNKTRSNKMTSRFRQVKADQAWRMDRTKRSLRKRREQRYTDPVRVEQAKPKSPTLDDIFGPEQSVTRNSVGQKTSIQQQSTTRSGDIIESLFGSPSSVQPSSRSEVTDGQNTGQSQDLQSEQKVETEAKKVKKTQEELKREIVENIRGRSEFSWRHRKDPKAYEQKISEELDNYAKEIGDRLGLFTNQRLRLRLALSEGLMRDPEMLLSVGSAINTVSDLVKGAVREKIGSKATEGMNLPKEIIHAKDTDARVFDYRSTVKRLKDVITREPLGNLEDVLTLSPKQKKKLESYRKELVESLSYKARTLYDDVRESLGRHAYTSFRALLLAAAIAGIAEAVKYIFN